MSNQHKPKEAVLIHQPVGLDSLGSVFNANAPFSACRLCGAVYQSDLDREQYALWSEFSQFTVGVIMLYPDVYAQYQSLEHDAKTRRDRWRSLHERRYHSDSMSIKAQQMLYETGMAFTPEAAHKLTSYGIFPTGNMHEEVVDAMATAPRAPLDDPEG